jgi:O-methyltransferase involved in polyketide biosynthesis
MSVLNLYDQLLKLIQKVQGLINAIDDNYPLKGWFAIELRLFTPGPRKPTMEELSARMRAVRQLEHMVTTLPQNKPEPQSSDESLYTSMSRVPALLLETVQQTNFSIEPSLLLEGKKAVALFDLVSPTAKVVSYLRNLDPSLSFAGTLSSPEESRVILSELGIVDPAVQEKLSVLFRARYHCMNSVVSERKVHQVLEIAAGISPRGLHWSREHPGTVYVESDLPILMREKAKAIRNAILSDPVPKRGVLHCCGLDALDLAGLHHALDYTDPTTGLVIVTEGLLLYFTADETQRFLKNMHTVLTERPQAVWVVDLVSQQNLADLFRADPETAAAVKRVFASTQREVVTANPFADESAIEHALQANGLRIVSQALLSDCALFGGHFPADSAPQVRALCGDRKIWTVGAS